MIRGRHMRFAHVPAPNSVPGGKRERIDLRYLLQSVVNSVLGGKGRGMGMV